LYANFDATPVNHRNEIGKEMKIQSILASASVAAATLVASGTHASAPAISFSSVSATAVQTDLSLGNSFVANTAVTVTALGYYNLTGTGFLTPHEVGIFDSTGTLIADAVLPAGNSDPLIGGYRYQAITPVTLQAGQTYNLVGEAEIGDPWGYAGYADFTVNPAITLGTVSYIYQSDNTLRDTLLYGSPYSWIAYSGPNFLISTGVPEPTTWAMVLVGFGVLGASARLRRRQARASA
jgi:hypothetical protein